MQRAGFLASASAFSANLATSHLTFANRSSADRFRVIEERSGGRLGVFALSTSDGRTLSHRADERFPMCSTFKFLAVASVLHRVDVGEIRLDRHVDFHKGDLLSYAPVTSKRVTAGSMTVDALCEAAIVYSDNTAANLLLRTLGSPSAVTRYARSLGDAITRLDRNEPSLNTALPGDHRDTTTPAAIARDMRRLLLGNALSVASRTALKRWLIDCRTGDALLRAGVPASWQVGDKTGTGGSNNELGASNTRNDIAIIWPPKRPAVIIAAYLTGATVSANARDRVLANVARIATDALT